MIPTLLFAALAIVAWAILFRQPPQWYDVALVRRCRRGDNWRLTRRGAGPSFPIAFLADHTALGTANTNRNFSAGTMPTIAAGVTGGKPITHVLVSIADTIAADTEIGLCSDNGSVKVPREAIPIGAYTPSAIQPTKAFLWPLVAPIQMPATTDLTLARIHTNDTIKVRPASVKFQ